MCLIDTSCPIGEQRVLAVFGLEQPHHAVREVVLHIPILEKILTQQADGVTAYFAAADQELDVAQRDTGERELLDGGDRGLG
jgi:hypothetical protein